MSDCKASTCVIYKNKDWLVRNWLLPVEYKNVFANKREIYKKKST